MYAFKFVNEPMKIESSFLPSTISKYRSAWLNLQIGTNSEKLPLQSTIFLRGMSKSWCSKILDTKFCNSCFLISKELIGVRKKLSMRAFLHMFHKSDSLRNISLVRRLPHPLIFLTIVRIFTIFGLLLSRKPKFSKDF